MATRSNTAAVPQLPTYSLYGEPQDAHSSEWLHCERIVDRGRIHDWEIRPHRHASLLQVLFVRRGSGTALADATSHKLRGPCVAVIPPMTVHGFSFRPEIDGLVLTIADQHARHLLAASPGLSEQVFALRVNALPREAARSVGQAVDAVSEGFHGPRRWRAMAVDAALMQLFVGLGRLADDDAGSPAARIGGAAHVERYAQIVEQRFRQKLTVAQCARELSITPTQLNRVCQRAYSQCALDMLHARVLLEAQRELAYTTMSIKQIALGLGFDDAAYFTRFFERLAGRTPSEWRRSSVGA
jgi:AraC family transcriptional regulator, transcriptional activator of pobA